jgi:thioesterase domain-containing protein
MSDLPTVVELNKSLAQKNIFCFHTFGGGINFYEGLAGLINDVTRVYGLEEPYIYDDFEYDSFPELASYHVETIRSIQPHGPYLFFGYCSGGPLAYEVAAQLEKNNFIF